MLPIVILLILLGLGYLATRAAADRITGAHQDHALYELVRTDQGRLELAPADTPGPATGISLDDDAMRRLAETVHKRNDLRLHTVNPPDGDEIPFEDHDPTHDPAPRSILVEASKGTLRIHKSGLIETQPPLDDAVTSDLLDALDEILHDAPA